MPSAYTIFLQGDAQLTNPLHFGDGLRCVGGTLKRLYAHHASGGAVHAPDAGAGDPPITARSAALGDPIAPGSTRYYQTYYRDPSPTFVHADKHVQRPNAVAITWWTAGQVERSMFQVERNGAEQTVAADLDRPQASGGQSSHRDELAFRQRIRRAPSDSRVDRVPSESSTPLRT
jgi:hypothetical protein